MRAVSLTQLILLLEVCGLAGGLGEVHVPTLLLVGDADIPDVHAHAGAIEAGIPGSRRIVVPGVGHIMYLEKPAEFSRLVIGFLERNGQ